MIIDNEQRLRMLNAGQWPIKKGTKYVYKTNNCCWDQQELMKSDPKKGKNKIQTNIRNATLRQISSKKKHSQPNKRLATRKGRDSIGSMLQVSGEGGGVRLQNQYQPTHPVANHTHEKPKKCQPGSKEDPAKYMVLVLKNKWIYKEILYFHIFSNGSLILGYPGQQMKRVAAKVVSFLHIGLLPAYPAQLTARATSRLRPACTGTRTRLMPWRFNILTSGAGALPWSTGIMIHGAGTFGSYNQHNDSWGWDIVCSWRFGR